MKWSSRILFMSEFLMGRKVNLILSIVLLTISFYLFDTTSTLRYSLNSEMREYEKLYSEPLKDVYVLSLSGPESDLYYPDRDMAVIDDSLKHLEQIRAYGAYSFQSLPVCDEWAKSDGFHDLMNKRELSVLDELYLYNPLYLPALCLQGTIDNIMAIPGVDRERLRNNSVDSPLPAYAGNAFKNLVTEGDILHFGDMEVEIVGFLEKGTKYAASPSAIGFGSAYYTPRLLDYHLVLDMDALQKRSLSYAMAGSMLRFVVFDQPDKQVEIKQDLQNKISEGPAMVVMKTIESYLSDSRKENRYEDEVYQRLFIFMFVLCLLTALSVMTISIVTQKRKIGIWMANGFLQKDLFWMVVISGFIRMAIPFIIALSIRMWSFTSGTITDSYREVHKTIVIPQMFLVMIISYVVAILVPILYLRRQSIMDLLKERV